MALLEDLVCVDCGFPSELFAGDYYPLDIFQGYEGRAVCRRCGSSNVVGVGPVEHGDCGCGHCSCRHTMDWCVDCGVRELPLEALC